VRIRPTELGLKGVLLLCALDLAFLATSYSNLFFLLLVFCVVLGALGLLWTFGNVRGITAQWVQAPAAAAGSPRDVRLSLSSRRRAAFDLAVALPPAAGGGELLRVPLLRGSTQATATLAGQPRGIQPVRTLQVTSRYPFGLFVVTRRLPVDGELVTHPRPLSPAEAAAGTADGEGDLAALAGHRSSTLAGLRPFQRGDSTADVHWKATARRGSPVVKERELDAGETVEIVLDRRCSAEALESALSLATTWLLEAVASERPVHLRSQGYDGCLGGSHRSPAPLLRWLAGAQPLPSDGPAPPAGSADAVHLPRPARREATHA
jgi:uncharacterized protein (DUF58 family)